MNKKTILLKVAKKGYCVLTQEEKDFYNASDMREILYKEAKNCIGKNMAPIQKSLGCVEALNNIAIKATGNAIGGGYSTYWLYESLKDIKRFKKIDKPLSGDIVISPTGHGNGKIKNGHTGIVSDDGKIMSNDSVKLLWLENYTLESWTKRFKEKGGFPVEFFRIL